MFFFFVVFFTWSFFLFFFPYTMKISIYLSTYFWKSWLFRFLDHISQKIRKLPKNTSNKVYLPFPLSVQLSVFRGIACKDRGEIPQPFISWLITEKIYHCKIKGVNPSLRSESNSNYWIRFFLESVFCFYK